MADVQTQNMPAISFDLFAGLESTNHEQIVFCQDHATGLKAIIAIHNTVLGPGLGGTRFWHYANERDAITETDSLIKTDTELIQTNRQTAKQTNKTNSGIKR